MAAKRHEATPPEERAAKEPVQQQIHRMFLLRVKLMHFVNSLHNYIMTRVGFFYAQVTLYLTYRWFGCLLESHVALARLFVRSYTAQAWSFSTRCRRRKIWTS